jgi:hypothetical protein
MLLRLFGLSLPEFDEIHIPYHPLKKYFSSVACTEDIVLNLIVDLLDHQKGNNQI